MTLLNDIREAQSTGKRLVRRKIELLTDKQVRFDRDLEVVVRAQRRLIDAASRYLSDVADMDDRVRKKMGDVSAQLDILSKNIDAQLIAIREQDGSALLEQWERERGIEQHISHTISSLQPSGMSALAKAFGILALLGVLAGCASMPAPSTGSVPSAAAMDISLRTYERVLPDKAVEVYIKDVLHIPRRSLSVVDGGFFQNIGYPEPERIVEALTRQGFSHADAQRYAKLLSEGPILVYPSSVISGDRAGEVMLHERIHYVFSSSLTEAQKRVLREAAQQVQARFSNVRFACPGLRYVTLNRTRDPECVIAVQMVREDAVHLYAYLSGSSMDPRVEQLLRAEHPQAAQLFDWMIQQASSGVVSMR